MSWALIMVLQIIVSTVMTIFTRQLSLSVKKVFFGVAVFSYIAVAACGLLFALIVTQGPPHVPNTAAWIYLLIEGVSIPAAWLIQYKLIGYIGASNTMIVAIFNIFCTAILGIALFGDATSWHFVIGAILILVGVFLAVRIQPDTTHHITVPLMVKIGLVAAGAVLFAAGLAAEKAAINIIGVWDYASFGWGMQGIGAIILFLLFGRKELKHFSGVIAGKGLILGAVTSIAGILYIYALSIGSLSHTVIATSGKTVLVMIVATILLRERNSIPLRIGSLLLTLGGLWLVLITG